jgi:hypothetical protein
MDRSGRSPASLDGVDEGPRRLGGNGAGLKPGIGWILAGIALLTLGVVVTMMSRHVVMYGAIVVGIIWIIRGIYRLAKS